MGTFLVHIIKQIKTGRGTHQPFCLWNILARNYPDFEGIQIRDLAKYSKKAQERTVDEMEDYIEGNTASGKDQ